MSSIILLSLSFFLFVNSFLSVQSSNFHVPISSLCVIFFFLFHSTVLSLCFTFCFSTQVSSPILLSSFYILVSSFLFYFLLFYHFIVQFSLCNWSPLCYIQSFSFNSILLLFFYLSCFHIFRSIVLLFRIFSSFLCYFLHFYAIFFF